MTKCQFALPTMLVLMFAAVVLPVYSSTQATDTASPNAQQSPEANDPPVAQAESVTLPLGALISVRVDDEINSNHDHPGDVFTGTVDPSVFIGDKVVIPRGTEAHIQMIGDKKGGRLHGKAEVELQLVSLVLDGERTGLDTDSVRKGKGALSTKAQGEIKPGAAGAAEVAASVNPVGAVALGGLAAFKAAKVDIKAGKRIPFTLSGPFTFTPPPFAPQPPDDNPKKRKKK